LPNRAGGGEGRARAVVNIVRLGRKQQEIKRRDHGEETLAEIGRSYNVRIRPNVLMISQLFTIKATSSLVKACGHMTLVHTIA
jgi:hypothetical protein